MSSTMRYRGGSINPVPFPTANDGVVTKSIEVGDLVYVSGGVAYPASYLSDQGTLAANQIAFALLFAGVAVAKTGLQSGETTFKITNDLGYVLVATAGEFEFDCDATSWAPGELVGAVENDDGDGLLDQEVAKVTAVTKAIGVAKVPMSVLGDSLTSIIVSIRSVVMREGVSGQ